uniref:Uncharacterized protein n=1 Tax=Lepeophtheirus salmonis TaxID=72036 RepID=A0A0K2UXG1_LEPSM
MEEPLLVTCIRRLHKVQFLRLSTFCLIIVHIVN